MHDELREHQHLVAVLEQLVEGLREGLELRTPRRAGGRIDDELRVAAGEAETRQVREELEALAFARVRIPFPGGLELLEGPLPEHFVEGGLLGRQRDVQRDLGALREVVEHIGLQAPQHERRDDASQPVARLVVVVEFHRFAEVGPELLPRAEQTGIQEAEQRMEIHQVVLDGCAGGHDAEARGQSARRPSPLRQRVLDRLGFVEHHAVPTDRGQSLHIVLQQAVGREVEVECSGIVEQRCPGGNRTGVDLDVERRREPTRLVDPVGDDGHGGDHQRGSSGCPVQENGQGLHRLAESHIVGKAGAGAPTAQTRKPAVAVDLVRSQLCLQGAG